LGPLRLTFFHCLIIIINIIPKDDDDGNDDEPGSTLIKATDK